MRPRTLLSHLSAFLVLSRPTSAYRLEALPFSSTFLDETPERSETTPPDTSPALGLIKRQSCPENYNSCSGLSNANAGSNCCAENSVCALDNAGNIACCPLGSFCTGTVTAAPTATSATPSSGATGSSPTITATADSSQTIVPNNYYPFPVFFGQNPHFSDAEQCSESYASCSSYYSQCTQQLQGGGFGVTVAAPDGGVTVAPGSYTDVGVQSATSICSSLSSQACPGSGATCTGAGGAAATTDSGFFIVTPGNDGSAGSRKAPGGAEMALLLVMGWFIVGCLE